MKALIALALVSSLLLLGCTQAPSPNGTPTASPTQNALAPTVAASDAQDLQNTLTDSQTDLSNMDAALNDLNSSDFNVTDSELNALVS